MSDLPGTVVTHDPQRSRYEITLDGAPVGLAAYVDDGGRRVFHHTEVQQAYRGRGLAATLVREALTGTRAEGRRIVPLCPYVQRWVSEHGEDLDGAVEQAGPDVVSTVRRAVSESGEAHR